MACELPQHMSKTEFTSTAKNRTDCLKGKNFSYLLDRVCSIFSGASKFCLAHGLRQLTRDYKSDIRILDFIKMSLIHYHENME